jgi:hypothetical protein
MMLSEAGVINLVILNVRDKMNAYQKKKWAGLTPTGLQDDIHDTLCRGWPHQSGRGTWLPTRT